MLLREIFLLMNFTVQFLKDNLFLNYDTHSVFNISERNQEIHQAKKILRVIINLAHTEIDVEIFFRSIQ